jgi:outer membrane receptor protein involved in Fe transport
MILPRYILSIIIILTGVLYSSNIQVSGYIQDSRSDIFLPDVNISAYCPPDTIGTNSDKNGYFNFTVSGDLPIELSFSHIGYETQSVTLSESKILQIHLIESSLQAPVLSISGEGNLSGQEVKSSIIKISNTDITESGFRNLEQTLSDKSSIIISRDLSGRETISIRGSNSNEVGVFVDGVLMNTPYYGNADLSSINLYEMEGVEVIKGGGSILMGSGYFGGVLNLKSKPINKNTFGMKYGGSSIYRLDRDRYYNMGFATKYIGLSYQFSRKDRPVTLTTNHVNKYSTLALSNHFSCGDLFVRHFTQSHKLNTNASDGFIADSTSQTSIQYVGRIPFAGENWTFQWTDRRDSNSDSYWEVSSMGQNSRDKNQGFRFVKSINWNDITAAVLLSKSSQDFIGSSNYNIDTVYIRNTDVDIFRESSALALTLKFHSYNISPMIDRISIESGYRFEEGQTELSKFDEHDLFPPYSGSRIDTSLWKSNYKIRTRKIGISAEGRYKQFSYTIFSTMSKDMRLPILRDIFNIEVTPIHAYRGNELKLEILNDYNLGVTSELIFSGDIPTSISAEADIFKNQYFNKSYYINPPSSPPIPVQTDQAEISGFHIGLSHRTYHDLLILSFNHTYLNLNDSRIFPFKPETKSTASLKLNWKSLTLFYQYFSEGRQFIPGGVNELAAREDANISTSFTVKKNDFKVIITYRVENLNGDKNILPDDPGSFIPSAFFQRYNEIALIQLSYEPN